MKIRVFSYHILPFVCAVLIFGADISILHAAEAKSAPVAQQKPTAQSKPAAQPKAQPKAQAKGKTSQAKKAPAKQTAKTNKAQPASPDEKLKSSLDVFAKNCIVSMNKQRRPGIHQKEVKRQPDGTFMARYLAVDPDSLRTSYNPTEGHKTISHIGRMDYHEVEYVSVGANQKQALAGPFNEVNRSPMTELIKYKLGKWTY